MQNSLLRRKTSIRQGSNYSWCYFWNGPIVWEGGREGDLERDCTCEVLVLCLTWRRFACRDAVLKFVWLHRQIQESFQELLVFICAYSFLIFQFEMVSMIFKKGFQLAPVIMGPFMGHIPPDVHAAFVAGLGCLLPIPLVLVVNDVYYASIHNALRQVAWTTREDLCIGWVSLRYIVHLLHHSIASAPYQVHNVVSITPRHLVSILSREISAFMFTSGSSNGHNSRPHFMALLKFSVYNATFSHKFICTLKTPKSSYNTLAAPAFHLGHKPTWASSSNCYARVISIWGDGDMQMNRIDSCTAFITRHIARMAMAMATKIRRWLWCQSLLLIFSWILHWAPSKGVQFS